jgi:hypothetical protein
MGDRNTDATIKRLSPLLHDPLLDKKVDAAAEKSIAGQPAAQMNDDLSTDDNTMTPKEGKKGGRKRDAPALATIKGNNNMMSQVVGIIIGSPEFQRR